MSTFEGLTEYSVKSVRKICIEYTDENNKCISRGFLIINDRKALGDKSVGLIEDIWTDENHRRKGLASIIMRSLILTAKREGCYKIVLMCSDQNVGLYEKLGFTKHQNAMRLSLS